MNILAIESSCDETAVAVVRDGRQVLADCISSQVVQFAAAKVVKIWQTAKFSLIFLTLQ